MPTSALEVLLGRALGVVVNPVEGLLFFVLRAGEPIGKIPIGGRDRVDLDQRGVEGEGGSDELGRVRHPPGHELQDEPRFIEGRGDVNAEFGGGVIRPTSKDQRAAQAQGGVPHLMIALQPFDDASDLPVVEAHGHPFLKVQVSKHFSI